MAGNTLEVSEATFQKEVLESDLPALVDFWAEWCGPCRALAPTIESVAAANVGKLKVCKLDVDGSPTIASRFGIRSIPTLLFFKDGQNVGHLVGNVSKGAIEDMVKKASAA